MNIKEMAEDNLILKILTGSHMYGTNTVDSDVDYIGICIPPKDFVLGIHKFEQYEERTNPSSSNAKNTKSDKDCTIYSFPKYIKLLADNNPNVLETVFVPENCIMYCNALGRELLENYNIFLSKRSYYKFRGYAEAQKRKLITKETMGLRSKIVEKYGYDTKFASHLIRLLLFGIELLETEKIILPTKYKKCLIDIKNGKWTLPFVINYATFLEECLDEAFKTTELPDKPDMEAIHKLQISLFEKHWGK